MGLGRGTDKVTCLSHIADDLIIYCPNISSFLLFIYFPSRILFYHRFSSLFLKLPWSHSLSLCVTENCKRSNKKKKKKNHHIDMSKCLSPSWAALLCNNSSYVLLRLDLESFIKAGPSRRRGERIAACVGGLGLRSPNSEGTDDIMDSHGKFMKLQFSSPEQSSQAVCILSAGAFNAPESQDRDTSRWYFKIWHSKRLEDLQALAGHFWNYKCRTGSGECGEEGWSSYRRILQTGTPVSLPAWIANSVSPPSRKDCYWSFPRLLLGILSWHRGEQDTDFCM